MNKVYLTYCYMKFMKNKNQLIYNILNIFFIILSLYMYYQLFVIGLVESEYLNKKNSFNSHYLF